MKKTIPLKPTKRKAKVPKPPTSEEIRSMLGDELRQRFWVENELASLLPKLAKKATLYELGLAIAEHLSITEKQIHRLIHVFDSLEERAIGSRSPVFSKFSDECHAIINTSGFGYDTDASLIAACQKIMTLEITSFTTLRSYALTLEEKEGAELLAVAIKQEKKARAVYSDIALPDVYFEQLA
jgi:ferritin-like metal-binding protein YciE